MTRLVVAFVKFQFQVIQIEIGKNAVFFHQEIADDRAGRFCRHGLADTLLALNQKVHLRAEGRAPFRGIEIRQKGIIFAIVNAPGMQTFRQDAGKRRFAHAQRTLDHDKSRWLRAALRLKNSFRRRRFRWHRFFSAKLVSPNCGGDYSGVSRTYGESCARLVLKSQDSGGVGGR